MTKNLRGAKETDHVLVGWDRLEGKVYKVEPEMTYILCHADLDDVNCGDPIVAESHSQPQFNTPSK